MSYQILVPLEGSKVDNEVIPYVRMFARRPDARITLLHVMPDLSPYTREYVETECARARERLHTFRERIAIDSPGMEHQLRMGDPVREILKFAALLPADLVIMPAHGRKGLDRLIHGSVTEDVLRQSRCPVLLPNFSDGRPEDRDIEHLFDRILVPIDGSGKSFGIISVVVDFARSYDSEVILFHDYMGELDSSGYLESGDVDKRIQDYRALLGYAGISVTTETTRAGRPVEDILTAVSSTGADLIAMATQGRTGLGRMTNGSVVEHVLRHADRPVLACNTNPGLSPDIEDPYPG